MRATAGRKYSTRVGYVEADVPGVWRISTPSSILELETVRAPLNEAEAQGKLLIRHSDEEGAMR